MNKEQKFTSTNSKMIAGGLEHLSIYQKTGLLLPQSLQLAPTDKCNLNCKFCSVRDRNKGKRRPNELCLEDIKKTIESMPSLKTVEISGGGDPTMYSRIEALIEYLDQRGLKIGLITNGVELCNISDHYLDKLTWLRISLSMLDVNKEYGYHILNIKGTLGFSYVWNLENGLDIFEHIYARVVLHEPEYVRIVPDCLDKATQEAIKGVLQPKIDELNKRYGKEVFFIQKKPYDVHKKCRIGFIKPFLNADGFFYHCSAVPLYHRYFHPRWRMGHMSKVDEIWTIENIKKGMNTECCEKGKCFFSEQNRLIEDIGTELKHGDFI